MSSFLCFVPHDATYSTTALTASFTAVCLFVQATRCRCKIYSIWRWRWRCLYSAKAALGVPVVLHNHIFVTQLPTYSASVGARVWGSVGVSSSAQRAGQFQPALPLSLKNTRAAHQRCNIISSSAAARIGTTPACYHVITQNPRIEGAVLLSWCTVKRTHIPQQLSKARQPSYTA